MHKPPRILIVDDNETNRDILRSRLGPQGYELLEAADGEEALAAARQHHPDLILLDVMMPKMDGIEACRQIKADASLPFMPVVLVTAKSDSKDVVAGLEAGADEYLTKPLDQSALLARVKSMLRMKELTDQVRAQAADLAAWNRTLEERVEQQLTQIERMDRMKRFLPPQVAELILSSGDDSVLDSHRRDVTVVFCDLRGFTAFSETSAPEEVMNMLREYHETVGAIIRQVLRHDRALRRRRSDGAVERSGPCPDSCIQAGAHGRRNARCSRRADRQAGATMALSSASGSASPTATPRSDASALKTGTNTPRSASCRTSLRVFAAKRKTGRS